MTPHSTDVGLTARPIRRLKVTGGIWLLLAAFAVIMAASVPHLSSEVLGGVLLRVALGVVAITVARALSRKPSAHLGIARFVFVLPAVLLMVFHETQLVYFVFPEALLSRAMSGLRTPNLFFRDDDTVEIVAAAVMLVQFVLALSILFAVRRTTPIEAPPSRDTAP